VRCRAQERDGKGPDERTVIMTVNRLNRELQQPRPRSAARPPSRLPNEVHQVTFWLTPSLFEQLRAAARDQDRSVSS
jgi:hypothetical protein